MLDLAALRTAHPLPDVVGASVKLIRAGRELRGCCPFHADRSPSFTIFDGGKRFHCFGCGAGGDVLDFVQRSHGVGLREAAALLAGGNLPSVYVPPIPPADDADRIADAKAIWRAAMPVAGTLAETYLRSRGLHLSIPESIRFTRLRYGKRGPEHPAMVACIASVDDKLVGIQRTYLNESGTSKAAVPKAKLSLGRVAGAAIRLAPCAAELVIAEGLEDALTLEQELGRAVWCAAGASMLPAMQFPAGVRSIAIGADNDAAGRTSATRAIEAFAQRGITARAFYPSLDFKDFNQELQEGGRA